MNLFTIVCLLLGGIALCAVLLGAILAITIVGLVRWHRIVTELRQPPVFKSGMAISAWADTYDRVAKNQEEFMQRITKAEE